VRAAYERALSLLTEKKEAVERLAAKLLGQSLTHTVHCHALLTLFHFSAFLLHTPFQ
jgi:ATP-dependent Zn protease